MKPTEEILEEMFDFCHCNQVYLGTGVLAVDVGFESHARALCFELDEPLPQGAF